MPPTIDEILVQEQRLKQEIADKQILLSALQILRSQIGKGDGSSAAPSTEVAASTPKASLEVASAPATSPPAPARHVHPELAAIYAQSGGYGEIVAWAIKQMTADYSVGDIASLLRREACNISGAQISVVISRLKKHGEIEEIRRGRGRGGSIFRKPESTTPSVTESTTGSILAP